MPNKRHATKTNFFSRTTPNSWNLFTDAEANIQTHDLPSFFESPVSQSPRRLCSLPTRKGGLNIMEPVDYETQEAASLTACAPLTHERKTHDQRTARLNKIRSRKKNLMESLQTEQRHVIEMILEKGASNWLTALPLKCCGFTLTKS